MATETELGVVIDERDYCSFKDCTFDDEELT